MYKVWENPGGTLSVEVIGMLVGNFCGKQNPEKYPDFDFKAIKVPKFLAQYPKNTNFTENFSETFHLYSTWKTSRP